MSHTDIDRMDDLRAAVATLSNTLSISEQRTARLERIIRWGGITIVLTLSLALATALQPLGYAIGQPTPTPSRSAEEAIDRLTQSLTGPQSTLGQMGMMMQNMMALVTQRAMSETAALSGSLGNPPVELKISDCRGESLESGTPPRTQGEQARIDRARTENPLGYYTKCFFLENSFQAVDGAYRSEDYQAALLAAMGGTAVELGVLVHRLRYDSDYVQQLQALLKEVTPAAALQGIAEQLGTLNHALASVPQMTADMNVMTQQMGVMTADMTAMTHHMGNMNYSVGSTMGRMGSWMPW